MEISFGQGNIHDVEEHLIGTRMVKADLIERLNDIDLTFYFGNLSVEEFVIYIELIAEIDVF